MLTNLSDILVDLSKISYVGKPDTHIEHSVQLNRIMHFFLIIVDGYPIEIDRPSKAELEVIRNHLLSLIETNK